MSWTKKGNLKVSLSRMWNSGKIQASLVSGHDLFPQKFKVHGPTSSEMPEKLSQVKADILAIPTAEIHGEKPEEGKLVVTLESSRQLALADLIDEVKDISGVIVVSLISNYLDEK